MDLRLSHVEKKYLLVGLIALVLFIGGYLAGARSTSTFAADGKTESKLLAQIKTLIDDKFIAWKASSTPPTDKELEYGIVKGYVSAYKDPYTVFFPPREAKSFAETVQGSFGGVGMQVGEKEGRILIIAPLKDSPAMKAGIKAGDIIGSVDGKDVSNMSSDEVVSMIRGKIGTEVTLTVLHKDAKQVTDIKIIREEIKIPTLDSEKKDGVFVVHLYNFSAESPDLFKKAMEDFLKSGTQYLVLDLRGNPGGYLEAAVNMASFFLKDGQTIVTEKKGVGEAELVHRSKGYDLFNGNLRMAILLDGGSASASEILAGALKDHNIAKVVGEKSFGKGSVQELINLEDGSSLKVTVAKWYTPNGVSISENGIKPDVEVKLDQKLMEEKKIDTQLQKAIDLLKNAAVTKG